MIWFGRGGEGMMYQQLTDSEQPEGKERLKEEIVEALKEWENAKRYFNYAVGREQVDYAIHAIITAEKRYAMLLGKAKSMIGPWPQWGR